MVLPAPWSESLAVASAVPAPPSLRPLPLRVETLDVASAIAAAEGAAGSTRLRGDERRSSIGPALAACRDAAERGERTWIAAPAAAFAAEREAMRAIASRKLGVVAHALAGHGCEELDALLDLGWGILSTAGPEAAFHLTLVARRVAEDARTPILLVHALSDPCSKAGLATAMSALPLEADARMFASAEPRRRSAWEHASSGDELTASLRSVLREYTAASGHHHDVVERSRLGDPALVIVGTGALGDAVVAAMPELCRAGLDVGALHVTSLRPFPAACLVKLLARAQAITVLEPATDPRGGEGRFARELKAAFTDALTWVPGFPGIGRVPRLFVGEVDGVVSVAELAAVCENMLAGDGGVRRFSLAMPGVLSGPMRILRAAGGAISARILLDDGGVAEPIMTLSASVLAGSLGLRTYLVERREGGATVIDIVGARSGARGGLLSRPADVVVCGRASRASRGAATLALGGLLVTFDEGGAEQLDVGAKNAIRARHARVMTLPAYSGGGAWPLAAACTGALVAAAASALGGVATAEAVGRSVAQEVALRGGNGARAGGVARQAFEHAHASVAP